MARDSAIYVCQSCGNVHNKWAGQCGGCGQWNTLVQETYNTPPGGLKTEPAGKISRLNKLQFETLESEDAIPVRMVTGIDEFDRVCGGGVVPGSAILIAGDPGVGKSTLLLQVAASAALKNLKVAYISGEEAVEQIRGRAGRMGLAKAPVDLAAETALRTILEALKREKFDLVIIDSIQTLWSDAVEAAQGSVSQVRACAGELVRLAKKQSTSIIMVGHVTKEGAIAGPRVLEHMVDTVLYFEHDAGSRYRIVRAVKNRFGAVNELGVFAMGDNGLREVSNPSALFLSRHEEPVPGSVITVTRQGSRPLLVEVQALVDGSQSGNPRRVALGLEGNRLAMLLAVLHRHAGIALSDQDVFANVVGGMRIHETAADLPLLLAALSSFRGRPVPHDLVVFGEVGLAGEIRPVQGGEERLQEAAKHGFKRAIVPEANKPRRSVKLDLEVIAVQRLSQALEHI